METFSLYCLLVLSTLILGILLGRSLSRKQHKRELTRAIAEERGKLEREKANLSVDLYRELGSIKDTIVESAKAYQRALEAIDKRLAVPADLINERLGSPVERQLHLEFSNPGGKEKGPVPTMGFEDEET